MLFCLPPYHSWILPVFNFPQSDFKKDFIIISLCILLSLSDVECVAICPASADMYSYQLPTASYTCYLLLNCLEIFCQLTTFLREILNLGIAFYYRLNFASDAFFPFGRIFILCI